MTEQAQRLKLRAAEWMLVVYFAYVAVLSAWRASSPDLRAGGLWVLLAAGLTLLLVARAEAYFPAAISRFRDFLPLGLTLAAFEEMNLFAPRHFEGRLEIGRASCRERV